MRGSRVENPWSACEARSFIASGLPSVFDYIEPSEAAQFLPDPVHRCLITIAAQALPTLVSVVWQARECLLKWPSRSVSHSSGPIRRLMKSRWADCSDRVVSDSSKQIPFRVAVNDCVIFVLIRTPNDDHSMIAVIDPRSTHPTSAIGGGCSKRGQS